MENGGIFRGGEGTRKIVESCSKCIYFVIVFVMLLCIIVSMF